MERTVYSGVLLSRGPTQAFHDTVRSYPRRGQITALASAPRLLTLAVLVLGGGTRIMSCVNAKDAGNERTDGTICWVQETRQRAGQGP